MAWASKTYTFSPSTTIASAEVNQNFDDMVDGLDTAMPSGGIIIWSGSVVSIPSGWYLCDGNNSTPNLVNRFIVGGSGTYSIGSTGGADSHTHTGTTGASGSSMPNRTDGGTTQLIASHTHPFTTDSSSSLPPYYALAYIMKS